MTIGSELSPGTFVDRRYQIKCVLGRGGFGRTYLAADERRFGELCVLKEFVPKNQGDSVVAQKLHELFHREAQILHKLNHPQIPKFFAVFEENDRLFIAQEYINGKTYWKLLQERQRQGSAFSEAEVVRWLRHLLPVLEYLHRQNIVHRDISPDNIMLPKDGRLPVLIDFGVVKQAAPHWYEVSTINPDGSIEASVSVGKLGYAPYEQIRIGQCSPRSDLYALGVTAVVLLTARPPNQLVDSKSLEWKWQSLVKVDPRLAKILETMMAEKPQDRYPSARAVFEDLEQLGSLPDQDKPHHQAPIVVQSDDRDLTTNPQTSTALFAQPFGTEGTGLLHLKSTFVERADEPNPSSSALVDQLNSLVSTLSTGTGRIFSQLNTQKQATTLDLPPYVISTIAKPLKTTDAVTRLTILVNKNPHPLQSVLHKVALLGGLAVLSAGGLALSVHTPYIAVFCKPLDNCAEGQLFEWNYYRASQRAEQAKTLSTNARTIHDLETARDRLSRSITQLSGIPASSSSFTAAQQALPEYRTLLQRIEERLEKETRATQLLERATTEAQAAKERTKAAKTRQDFQTARSLWRKAVATVGAIPTSSFIASQAEARSQQYAAQLQEIDSILATRLPNESAPAPSSSENLSTTASARTSTSPTPRSSTTTAQPQPQPQQSTSQSSPAPASTSPNITSKSTPQSTGATPPASPPSTSRSVNPSLSAPSVSVAPTPRSRSTPPSTSPSRADRVTVSHQATNPVTSGRIAMSAHPTTQGDVALVAAQTLNNVSVRLRGARVTARGTFVANLQVENHSNRAFGFVPLFTEVRDANGQPVQARVMISGSGDGMVEPGETLTGELYLIDRYWNNSGSQNLTLVIREGTSGNRNFYLNF